MHAPVQHVAPADRVRANTHPEVNDRIDRHAQQQQRAAADEAPHALRERLGEVNRECDFERIVEAEVAVMGLTGIILGAVVGKKFLLLPGFSAAMLLHAVHGWYPLLPLFRRMGIRTQDEIDRERYALKSMHGDFEKVREA